MKKLNDNLVVNMVDLNNWKYDDDDYMYPITYEVNITFYGKEYTMYFTTDDLKRFDDWGLQNSGMEGDSDLFDSMDSYFENERHDEEAKVLMSMMKDEWEQNWRDDSVYDYLGNREKETE